MGALSLSLPATPGWPSVIDLCERHTSQTKEHPTLATKMRDLVLSEICHALDIPALEINHSASFIQLGGHSLSAIALASACKWHGLYLSVESILRSDSISKMFTYVVPISSSSCPEFDASRKALPKGPLNPKSGVKPAAGTGTVAHVESFQTPRAPAPAYSRPRSNHTSTTEMQLSLIHGSQNHPGTNIISFFETYLTKDVPIMRRAWKAVIDSEPIFQTVFDLSEGKGDCTAQTAAPFMWTETVVHNLTAYDNELEEQQLQTEVGTSFKVVTLEKSSQGPTLSTIIWRVHHALIDGFSAALVYKKVRQAAGGRPIQPGTSFAEVVRDLQALQQKSRTANQLFWKQQQVEYHSAAGELLLPKPSIQRSSNDNTTMSVTLQIPVDQLSACARHTGVSLASLYYGAWALALSMYTDSDAVVFGIVLSGRNLPLTGVEDTVGPLINTLPFNVLLNRASTTTEYLRHIFNRMIELGSFQSSLPEDGFTRQFSSALAMEFEMVASESDGIQPVGKSYFKTVTDVPLSVFMGADGTLRLCYHCKTYNKTDIELLAEHYRNALLALLTPHHTVEMCMEELVSCESQENLRKMGNCISNTTTVSSVHDDLVTLFERAVAEYPGAIAIEKGEQSLTYREVDALANRVSNHISQHIQPGDVVCVHADRSINWIIAIYGILKAGGVYCPLDAALPSHLRDSIFQSAGSKLFLTQDLFQKTIKPSSCTLCFAIEELLLESHISASPASGVSQRRSPRPSANAYLCFTSGSSGKPKGVICSHEGLVAFQKDLEVRLFAEPGQKISQMMSPAFDGSIHEIFSTLSYGATLVLAHSADPFSHLRLVDSAILTPSIAKILVPGDFSRLSNVYLVGEPVPQHVNDVWASQKRLYNMYGPTEGTCGATIKRLLPGQAVSIGSPNPSTRVYILDRHQCLVPPGVVGEVYIAGIQVARGYIGRPDETAKRFLADSISRRAGERMYRTGDRGYWNYFGEIECLGRNDRQIKLRGFRLDLNDLEIRMTQAVPAAIAVALAPKDDYLVAMVQPVSLDVADFRSKVAEVLPVHALPRHITAVDKFPMTSAGKLDYRAIINNVRSHLEPTVKALSTSSERALAGAWREALSISPDVPITGDSNFVDLGGHSILQLRLVSRLTTLFGRRIPFRLIVQSTTLHDLARAIDGLQSQEISAIGVRPESALGEHELSPMEREWWHKYELDEGSSAFNVTFACVFNSKIVDRGRLTTAWNVVMARHRILRCRYVVHRRLGVKRTYSDYPPQVQRVNSLNVWKEINRPFRLKRNDPIRVTISRDQMVVCISHIVCDLTTLQVLLREVASVYSGACLPLVKRTYMDTSLWSNIAFPSDLDFWIKYLENAPERPHGVKSIPGRHAYSGSSHVCKVPLSTYLRLVNFTETRKFTFHQLSLAAVALALGVDAEDTDVVLGGPFFNRQSDDDLETVGLFLEPLPIRVRYSPTTTASESISFVQSVQEASQSALAHAVPWNQLLQHLQITPDFPDHPLLDTMVTFHDDRRAPKFPLRGVEPLITWTEGAKFKLLCEFFAVSEDTLLLRLEHDTDSFSHREVLRIERLIVEALDCLSTDVPYVEIKRRLRRTAEIEPSGDPGPASLFGARLSAL